MMLVNPFGFGPETDPHFASVVFLSGFEGSDGSTSFTDESGYARAVSANGTAQIDTAQAAFGTSSLLLDGSSGCFASCADSGDWDLPGSFTIEAWTRPVNSGAAFNGIISHDDLGPQRAWALYRNSNSLFFDYSLDGASATVWSASAGTIPLNAWSHVAVTRDAANVMRLFFNGALIKSETVAGTFFGSTAPLRIGARLSSQTFNGWIDEARVTKGAARYTAAFTPPTSAFPRV